MKDSIGGLKVDTETEETAKRKKAQKISNEIYKWLSTYPRKPLFTKRGVKAQITKIIKKNL